MNIATGITATDKVTNDIVGARDLGTRAMQAFITHQMKAEQSVFSPIPKNKLKTLSFLRTTTKLGKSGTSKAVINTDRELFNRLLVVAKSRSIDLREVFTHEMSPIPFP